MDVYFKSNSGDFADEEKASQILDPLIEMLKIDPLNKLEFHPTTPGNKGDQAGYRIFTTAEDVLEERKQTITDYMHGKNVPDNQFKVTIDDKSYKQKARKLEVEFNGIIKRQ